MIWTATYTLRGREDKTTATHLSKQYFERANFPLDRLDRERNLIKKSDIAQFNTSLDQSKKKVFLGHVLPDVFHENGVEFWFVTGSFWF